MLLQGNDPADPLTAHLPPSAPMPDLKLGVKDLRLARLPDSERAEFDLEILAAYDHSLKELAAMGPISSICRRVARLCGKAAIWWAHHLGRMLSQAGGTGGQ
jgi:hypothetical protein